MEWGWWRRSITQTILLNQSIKTNVKVRHVTKVGVAHTISSFFRLGIGPDGKPLPQANKKKQFFRMYPVQVVNQDGSTYTINHRSHSQVFIFPFRHTPIPQGSTPDSHVTTRPIDSYSRGDRGEGGSQASCQRESLRGGSGGGGGRVGSGRIQTPHWSIVCNKHYIILRNTSLVNQLTICSFKTIIMIIIIGWREVLMKGKSTQ